VQALQNEKNYSIRQTLLPTINLASPAKCCLVDQGDNIICVKLQNYFKCSQGLVLPKGTGILKCPQIALLADLFANN
jgi:hypothetical protein